MTFRSSIQAAVLIVFGAAAGCTVKNSSADGGASTCGSDSTVTCTQGAGYSCTGADTPAESNPLVCSKATVSASGDKVDYCCVASTSVSSSCSQDSAVSCTNGATGFACTSTDTPDQSDTTLLCSLGIKNGSATDYCCMPNTQGSSTCKQDSTIMCPQAGSYGFTCTGTDTPAQADKSLTCSTPTVSGSNNLYCCY